MRFIDGTIPRFAVAGVVNTGATYIAYLLLLQVASYRVAFTLAFVLGILLSYALSALFVFRQRTSWRTFLRFPWIYVVQYLLGLLLVTLAVEWLGLPAWLAPLAALSITIPLTYLLSRALFAGEST